MVIYGSIPPASNLVSLTALATRCNRPPAGGGGRWVPLVGWGTVILNVMCVLLVTYQRARVGVYPAWAKPRVRRSLTHAPLPTGRKVVAMDCVCYMCETEFQADPKVVKLWADSGRSFDPTDWECPECSDIEWGSQEESDYLDYLDSLTD